jgi:ATP-binding cassette, subfamily B, bacterial
MISFRQQRPVDRRDNPVIAISPNGKRRPPAVKQSKKTDQCDPLMRPAPPPKSCRAEPAAKAADIELASSPASAILWRRAWSFLVPYWPAMAVALAAVVFESGAGLLPPLVVRGLIDDALPAGLQSQSLSALVPYLLLLVMLPVIGCLVGLGQDYLLQWMGERVQRDMRDRLFRHLQSHSLRFFTSTPSGELVARVSDDVAEIRAAFCGTLPSLASVLIQAAGAVAILFWMSWPLALAVCLILPLLLLPVHRVGARQQKLAEEMQQQHARMVSQLHGVLNVGGYMLMRLFDRGEHEAQRFAAQNVEVWRYRKKLLFSSRWMGICFSLIAAIGPAAVYGYGGWMVIRGQITIGVVVAFVAYLSGLYAPVMGMAGLFVGVQEKMGIFRRVVALLDGKPEIRDLPAAPKLGTARGALEFDRLTFAYGLGQPPALCDVSFRACPGQLIALVGPSGAGKTSAANLLARFYDPQSGVVRIDGVDVRTVTHRSVLAQIAMVTQDTYLFHDTIRANLLYARPDASEHDLEAACRAARIHEVIESQPDGYDTVVGERGAKLSGGQRQRLAIARALLKDPPILVLDEATSALDSTSERLIQEALATLRHGRTTLVIAHRLSTILAADVIVVLDQGRVVETGTHQQLLGRNGLYARLCREQFAAVAR